MLAVDDDPAITEFLRWALRAEYDVTECSGVVEALSAIRLRAPDAVVTDLDMDGGGGKHLLAAVADTFPSVKRLVYSAAQANELILLVRSGLAHAAVSKTQNIALLASELQGLLLPSDKGSSVLSDSRTVEGIR